MSRLGKLPVSIGSGVTASVDGGQVSVKGPKGELLALGQVEGTPVGVRVHPKRVLIK